MDEQRVQAYINLINQLLTCPNGEENQILNANRELVDAGLLQGMAIMSQQLEENGNQNAANFLRHLHRQLAEALGRSETSVYSSKDYQQFVMEVLQATEKSQGKPDIVYSLLKANLDKLDNNFIPVLQSGAEATLSKVESSRARDIAAIIANFSILIQQFPLGNKAMNTEISIAACEISLKVFTRNRDPQNWGLTQNTLGKAYYLKGTFGNKAENLEKAISAYELALKIRTRTVNPIDWAATQNYLGHAYLERVLGDKAENLEMAIAAYKNALQVGTREAFPTQWAMVQNDLGIAYYNRISGDKAENLEMAIAACENALQVNARKANPINWAAIQNNLGLFYSNRILGDRKENLEVAIAFCKKALQVYDRETLPIKWAETQHNLGSAYSKRIYGDQAENLEMAIAAYENALQVRTCEANPTEWANTQNGLGLAYSGRISGDRANNLEMAIAAYQNAQQIHTREANPTEWASYQHNWGMAYSIRIYGDRAENQEMAIAAYENALEVYTKEAFPNQWAMTLSILGLAYSNRIKGERTENMEMAIAAYQKALLVLTREAFPYHWAITQNHLGNAYNDRIKGDRTENLEMAIAAYQNALLVLTPKAEPVECLRTSGNLGNLHFQQGNWQSAIDAYKQAITAVELSRSWSKDDDRRQEILKEAIGVYENIVQCFVNLHQYDQAFEYTERSRSRQLVDLMASKDLYHQGEIPPEVEELLQQFLSLERQIDRLRYGNGSRENREITDAAAATRSSRAALEADNENIARLEAAKREINRQIRKLDPVLAEGIQVAPLEFAQLQELIEDDTTAILSFYSTNYETHAFIVRRSGVNVHTCQGQGIRELQTWLDDNWLKSYLIGSGETSDWRQQMPSKLAEIARRLELDKLVEKLGTPQKPGFSKKPGFSDVSQKPGLSGGSGIQELILIPHLYLHQIPFAALPLADGQYFGDKFLIRTLASCQVLDFCRQRPPLETQSPTYGIVEDATENLPCAGYEGGRVAEMYGVAVSQYLKGSQATVGEYKKLLPRVQRLLSSHHAESRLDNNLESSLRLADGRITLGQLLSPALRFPNLDEVFLSCCETNLGHIDISDSMMTLNTGFLCAGARGAVSSLWSVGDLATSLFSVFYHELRQAGQNRPQALQAAQQQLRQLTRKEFKKKYLKELEKAANERLERSYQSYQEAQKQRDSYPEDSQEYRYWEQESARRKETHNRISDQPIPSLKQIGKEEHPFAHPVHWSGFICAGLR